MNSRLLSLGMGIALGCGLLTFPTQSMAQQTSTMPAASPAMVVESVPESVVVMTTTTQPAAAASKPASGGEKVLITTVFPWPDLRAIIIGSVAGLILFFLLSWLKSNRHLQSPEDVRIAEEAEKDEPDAPKPLNKG